MTEKKKNKSNKNPEYQNPVLSAAQVLDRIFSDKAYSDILIDDFLKGNKIEQNSRAFFTALTYGTAEKMRTVEAVLNLFVKKKPSRTAKYLCLVGIYRILFTDAPDSACCNDAAEASKTVLSKAETGFVNGVLRNVCRRKDEVLKFIASSEDGIKYSLSNSLCRVIKENCGEKADAVFASLDNPPFITMKVNESKISDNEFEALLSEYGCDYKKIEAGFYAVTSNADKIIKNTDKGYFLIIGLASYQAVKMLGAKSGERIIDICACPGGKSLCAGMSMQNSGEIVSLDIHENKFSLLKKSADSLGIDIITTEKADGREPLEKYINTADRVICDVPCTSTGMVGKKPEIRYKDTDSIDSLLKTQKAILHTASLYLKSGGTAVYSTCSLDKRENEDIVADFLQTHADFEKEDEKRFYPCDEFCAGFYCAKLLKK